MPVKNLGCPGVASQWGPRGFPLLAQLLAAGVDILFSLFQCIEDVPAFYYIARAARCHQIARIVLTLSRSWNYKIHRHYQRVLETGHAVKPTILTLESVPPQNVRSLFRGQWLGFADGVRQGFRS